MASLQLFDSSVLIPWLRNRHYDDLVTSALNAHRFVLSPVVWMELYAGTQQRNDKQDLDRMANALKSVGRIVSPEPEDFYTAGQIIAYYSRQFGQIKLQNHISDVLIALGAWRMRAELVTVNRADMERWQKILKRSKKTFELQSIVSV